MSLWERLSRVARAEVNHRIGRRGKTAGDFEDASPSGNHGNGAVQHRTTTSKSRAVTDVVGALRILELQGSPLPTLDVIRARYFELAQRMHPKTRSRNPDEAHAAHAVQEALVDALEILEEKQVPLSFP